MNVRADFTPVIGIHTGVLLYAILAKEINRFLRCSDHDRIEVRPAAEDARDEVNRMMINLMPSGSGVDSGSSLDWTSTKRNRIVIDAPYHHMDEHGFYCAWSSHQVIVTPDLEFGFSIRITGINTREIKEYLSELFSTALSERISLAPNRTNPDSWEWHHDRFL